MRTPFARRARRPRALLWLVQKLWPLALVLCWSHPAQAYTWMIRHGYGGCTTCHSDPSGGELLTPYGRAQGDLLLRMRYGKDTVSGQASQPAKSDTDSFDSFDSFDSNEPSAEPKKQAAPAPAPKAEEEEEGGVSPSAGFLWGLVEPPDFLWLGGGYRHAFYLNGSKFRTFPMLLDVYGELRFGRFHAGGTLGGARVPAGSPYARAAQITTNQDNQWNLLSRTHWLAYDFGADKEVTVRAGRLNLPFGVRIPEHTMWVRDSTHTNRESQQEHGVAVAYNGAAFRGEIMGIAGNYQINPDRYRERGYSGYGELGLGSGFALGASSSVTVAQADRYTLEEARTVRGAHGPFVRAVLVEPLVLLAEADVLHTSRRQLGYVGFTQLDYELVQGLHFDATGEVLDAGYEERDLSGNLIDRAPGAGKPRLGGWLTADWFFLPHFEARVDAIVRQDASTVSGTTLSLLAQLHFYL
jgi:hypothetical protein